MNNNDRLTRLRYAVDIKDDDMLTLFSLGGTTVTQEELLDYLTKLPKEDKLAENIYKKPLDDEKFERFLNGLITAQRGARDDGKEAHLELNSKNANNIMLKKVKIAFSLTSHDILDIMALAGLEISNSELSAVLRKEGHRNYKTCGDRYLRYFLKGLALDYRSQEE